MTRFTVDQPDINGGAISLTITGLAAGVHSITTYHNDLWATLTYSLPAKPTNATIGAGSGVISWRPLVTQANSTHPFSVVVTDNGSPSLSAT